MGTRNYRDFHSSTVELLQQREGFGIVLLEAFGAVGGLGAGHVEIAMGAEIPHGQFGEKFVGVGGGVGFEPKTFVERAVVLF